ncbi:MAG: core-2/I-branching enzyme, partial [Flavobacterium sp.]
YIKFHKYSLLPDEMFFQTIIMNSQRQESHRVIKSNLTYTRWIEGEPSPVVFTSTDFNELMNQSDKLFARKFDVKVDDKILKLIDDRLSKECEYA